MQYREITRGIYRGLLHRRATGMNYPWQLAAREEDDRFFASILMSQQPGEELAESCCTARVGDPGLEKRPPEIGVV